MSFSNTLSWRGALLSIALSLACMPDAHAQMLGPAGGLPGLQTPSVGMPNILSVPRNPLQTANQVVRDSLTATRQIRINTLLRTERKTVAVDLQGAPILRGVFLTASLSPAQRETLRAIDFLVDDSRAQADAQPGFEIVVLRDTRRRPPAKAMKLLERTIPDAGFVFEHLYLPAGSAVAMADLPRGSDTPTASPRRIGLLDGGVDAHDPALANALIMRHGCNTVTSSRHGTMVAARLVEGHPDRLFSADLWCGQVVGGATSKLIDALGWMARERVPVINISLVGPDNPLLARAVATMLARGHVLVSAVGNDGPAAPALFPAAYPGVIGVSAVDAKDQILAESGSGEHVDFCALGIVGQGRTQARGTSFAAPIVARRAAALLGEPRVGAPALVKQQLAADARDLGRPGRDPRYGEGVLEPKY